MSFNINTKKIEEVAFCHLNDFETDMPLYADAEETLPVGIMVYSKGSKAWQRAQAEISRKNLARKGKEATFAQNVEDYARLLAAVSKESVNLDMGDGVQLTTTEQFLALYTTGDLYWVKDAVGNFLNSDANFTQK